jgi:glucose-1-phosphate cytidylyltransferase
MKVVLFCGGLGTRMREHSETIPKPLASIGPHPIIWHLMKYYAHFGHDEFVLCLGHRGDLIREYFERNEHACAGWKVHLVDTGPAATIGDRLRAIADYVRHDELFLANYSDGLSDVPMPDYLSRFRASGAVAGFVSARISQSYHFVSVDPSGLVTALTPAESADVWINGGFFAFRPEIFEHLSDSEELVELPFRRLMNTGKLFSYKHHGFWAAMDTYKDKVQLDRRYEAGTAPWEVWKSDGHDHAEDTRRA